MNTFGMDGLIIKAGVIISLGIWVYGAIASTNIETAAMYGVLGAIGMTVTFVIGY